MLVSYYPWYKIYRVCIKEFKTGFVFLSFCFSKYVLRGLIMSCVTQIYVGQNVQRSPNCFRTHWYLVKLMHFSLFEYNFVYLSLAYRTKRYLKCQHIYILLFHLRAIFSEPGSSSQHGKPFLLKGNFIKFSKDVMSICQSRQWRFYIYTKSYFRGAVPSALQLLVIPSPASHSVEGCSTSY